MIYVDADACPVKAEIYRVAERHQHPVTVVANAPIAVPRDPLITRVVVTADVPLAARCVKTGASVLGPTGKPFSDASIGMALATRNLMDQLRSAGEITGGPKPFSAKDRSAFLQALDRALNRIKRGQLS